MMTANRQNAGCRCTLDGKRGVGLALPVRNLIMNPWQCMQEGTTAGYLAWFALQLCDVWGKRALSKHWHFWSDAACIPVASTAPGICCTVSLCPCPCLPPSAAAGGGEAVVTALRCGK